MLAFVSTSPMMTQEAKALTENVNPVHSTKKQENNPSKVSAEQDNKKTSARFPIVPRSVNSSQQVIKGMRQTLMESAF